MQVPPKKPHFFKPVQPGFKNGLKIPVGFLKYLKGHEQEHVVLRRAGKKWLVKLTDHRLQEGWEKFAEEHDLQLGDILVFRHEGDMEFEVDIFDSSRCDREYQQEEEQEAHTFEEKTNPRIMLSSKAIHHTEEAHRDLGVSPSLQPEVKMNNLDDKTISDKDLLLQEQTDSRIETSVMTAPISQVFASTSANPHFFCTIKPYMITYSVMNFPMAFAKSNGLMKKSEMILVDEKQRSWPVCLGATGTHFVIRKGGWTQFTKENDVRVGDTYKFELINNGTVPTAYFHRKYSGKDDKNHRSHCQDNEAAGTGQVKEQ